MLIEAPDTKEEITMPSKHVDFKYVRQNADFARVIASYGIDILPDGRRDGQFKSLCPFHDDKKPSLKVNTAKNIFHCFACDAGGNVLEFVKEMDGCSLRQAAIRVAELSAISPAPDEAHGKHTRRRAQQVVKEQTNPENQVSEPVSDDADLIQRPESESEAGVSEKPVNPPLSFELKNLVTDHPFLTERGLNPDSVAEFGLGIASRGIMKDRLVFPIHNKDGELVAYCGRYLGNEVPEEVPKYKQPPNFRKELELFNWHRVKAAGEGIPLIIVESFFSVVNLHAIGKRCVSPMGRSLSDTQIELLIEGGIKEIILLFDGDDPGRAAIATEGRKLLAKGFAVTAPIVAEDFKPHRANVGDLNRVFK